MDDIDWKSAFHSEHALRLDYEMEVEYLKRRLEAKEKIIKNLEEQLPKSKKIIWVVCKSREEYRSFNYHTLRSEEVEYRFLSSSIDFRGFRNPEVRWVGRWIEHPDIINIITMYKVASA